MKKIYLFLLSVIAYGASFSQAVLIADNPSSSVNIVLGQSNYHASESIYTDAEIGSGNFLTAGSAIQQLFWYQNTLGLNPAVSSFKVYMKNISGATTALTTGAYSTAGYTLVYSGALNVSAVGLVSVTLTTPFVRTAGSNLEILLERLDNTLHTGAAFDAAVGISTDATVTSSRRYNGTTAPVSGTTSLTATVFRPAIVLNHTFPVDAGLTDFVTGDSITCYNAPLTFSVALYNAGSSPIAAGTASVTLHVRGANTHTAVLTNPAILAPLTQTTLNFSGINLPNGGENFDTAFVTLLSDGTTFNDTITSVTTTATTLSGLTITENAETPFPTPLPVFNYVELLSGADQLWTLQTGNYTNGDQLDPLVPQAPGSTFYLFDSYSGTTSSAGFSSRLYSNCINLANSNSALLTFDMSHDPVFATSLDSIYVNVSNNHGATWTRLLPGFQRADALALTPYWTTHSVNLAAYLGQTIQIGFEGVSQWGNAIGLDNITITRTAPVGLLSFDAQRSGRVNNISWKTSQEENTNRFVIERSNNEGRSFSPIGEVAAAGNSTTARSYRFTDPSPVKGYNYYRLRIVDNDNSIKYSPVKNVRNLGSADLSVAPNPVVDLVKIKLEADKADKGFITIFDLNGKQVYGKAVTVFEGQNNIEIQTDGFSKGSYIIKVQLSDDRIIQRFTKL